jgi:hypothetical protein
MSNFLEKVQEKLEQNKKTSSGTVDLSNEAFPGLPVSAPKPVASWIPKKMNTGITDRFEIPAKMLVYHINKARQQLGKQTSASQVCKEVMNKFKSKIEYSTNQKSQSMTFLISGSAEAVNLSKKYLMNTLTIKVLMID